MIVIVTGSSGQLGYDIMNELKRTNFDVYAPSSDELDMTNQDKVSSYVKRINPDVIIHAAAYTNVEEAETDRETAYNVNVNGTRNIAAAAETVNARLCYISTDFVFDGTAAQPYEEFDIPNPINEYGKTKWMGEELIRGLCTKWFIVRTSWIFGENGKNFVSTMLKLAETRDTLQVVDDEIGSPTYTPDLAAFLTALIQTEKYGIYHASNTGKCSRHALAEAIFEEACIDIKVEPIISSQFASKVTRPKYSVLGNNALIYNGFQPLREWREALKAYLNHIQKT
ncbi:dTDP-4-dehydrorhamnose reductase [Virgibacillus siamensis]|uniref:dTDP-4-dehydrorhamnose reductase n=1 Tax=Virgibacillus siamensis TaxID=480071 RepID=UPI000984877F|nr:dTDP-4-dehydrorhamnose reductase [Virgibacillus siamensis]